MGKSTAVSCAAGKRLFDIFDITEPHKVLLLQSENSLKATKARVKALMDTYRNRVDFLTYQEALNRIFTTLTSEHDPRLTGNILDDKFSKTLKEILEATGAEVCILDPLISYHRQNENDNTKMREALDQLTKVVGPEVSVIVTHHHSKSIEATGANKARGASAILDWARGILTLNRQNHESRNLIRVSHTKSGNFKPASPFLLEVDGPCVIAVEPDVMCPPSKAVEILYDLGGTAKSKNEFIKAICDALDVSRRTAFEAINKAVEFGFIRTAKEGLSYVYSVTNQ